MPSFLRNFLLPIEHLVRVMERNPGTAPMLGKDNPYTYEKMKHMKTPRIQFILKYRDSYYADEAGTEYSLGPLQSGLWNSARFMSEMLKSQGMHSEIIQVADNNAIDREVTRFKPDIVIVEAYWVVPSKFEVLRKLHPHVKWVIRNHSKIPFLANEGIALDWTEQYAAQDNVYVSSNSPEATSDVCALLESLNPDWTEDDADVKCPYLPNYYPIDEFMTRSTHQHDDDYVDIGCFGAIRPLKNHVLQAIAALKFAKDIGKTLRFHVNAVRLENKGEPVLRNLRAIFANSEHELVEHPWMNHEDFLSFIQTIDVGMQVSYTETFNIVAADLTSQGVPVVTSDEIPWSAASLRANPNDSDDIVRALYVAYYRGRLDQIPYQNVRNLTKYNSATVVEWTNFITNLTQG